MCQKGKVKQLTRRTVCRKTWAAKPSGVKDLMETSTEQIGNVLKIKVIGRLVAGCAEDFKQMLLSSTKANNQILRIALYDKDNTIYTYHIEQFKSNVTLADSYFVFDKSKYHGVEVNDMR